MKPVVNFIFLYPYPYQIKAHLISFVILAIIAFFAYFVYSVTTSGMTARVKERFNHFLKIAGIFIVVLFFAELTVSLITTHQINKQLGFNYATPDTPEGELFEIQKVVPGKIMDKAGLKRFDRVQMSSVNKLYRLLIDNQGKEVVVPVVRDKQKIEIRIQVSEMDLPLAKISFFF